MFAPVRLAHEEDEESISCYSDQCFSRGFFAIFQIIVGRAGIEPAHRSTKATRLATGARLASSSGRAAVASVSFRASNHEPSIMKPEASGYRRGVAWCGMAQRRVTGPPVDFSSLHRQPSFPSRNTISRQNDSYFEKSTYDN